MMSGLAFVGSCGGRSGGSFGSFVQGLRRLPVIAAAAAALMALAACGGGDRVSTFSPQRLLVFGDEASVIAAGNLTDVDGNVITAQAGAKYTVNALEVDANNVATGALACNSNQIWVQVLASRYAIGFPECNPYTAAPVGRIYAQVGARVATLTTQVATATSGGGFSGTDLVTVAVGQRDILEIYAQYPATQTADGVVALAEAAGRNLGTQVNAIANAGGKVLVATVPNQGITPYAAAQNAISGERSAVLQRMTERFNAGLRGTLMNDGRLIGLVQADEQIQLLYNNAAAFGYISISTAACTVASPGCTAATLVSGATISNYLWADDRHYSVDAHVRVGTIAVNRAVNNPF
jgi:outer membrane lipase/esterase